MTRKKEAIQPVGDPFFDEPSEVYWAKEKENQSLKPTRRTGKFKAIFPGEKVFERPDTENLDDLNKLSIPISNLRMRLAELQTMGANKIPLGALLLEIQKVYRDSKNNDS